MELSSEDALRISVMLANKPQAIRIDESRMILYALSEKGEAQIKLNPTCRDEAYLKLVRARLSTHVLGTPAGYPVHIRRWARMGQVQHSNLQDLLLLGEPEAVVAVVYAEDLTEELAICAWWAMEEPENARQLLRQEGVTETGLGKQLANYLIEFLPFETEPEAMIDSVELVLKSGFLDEQKKLDLWKKARRKLAFLVGFLAAGPSSIPEQANQHRLLASHFEVLNKYARSGHQAATLLLLLFSPAGQMWLTTFARIMEKPANQETVNRALDAVSSLLQPVRPEGKADLPIEQLLDEAQKWVRDQPEALAELAPQLTALRLLSGLGYGVVRPVFSKTDAMGSLMRRKLQPIVDQLIPQVKQLL